MSKKPHLIFIGFSPSVMQSIDCDNYNVSIIVHDYLAHSLDKSIREKLAAIGVLDVPHNMNLDEYMSAMDQIETLTKKLIAQHGHPKAFIGLYEHVTLPAAILREKYGVPGSSVETAVLCRDKVKMKEALIGTDIRYPLFMAVNEKTAFDKIERFTKNIKGKIVLKPRSQAASEGIFIFNNINELRTHFYQKGFENHYQLEEFIEGRIFHFDGIVRNGELLFFSASEYTASCYEYVYHHIPFASITIDDPECFSKAVQFSKTILEKVKLKNGVFHLEAFCLSNNDYVFLEIANRFGGAGVVPLMQKAYGIDLIKELMFADMLEPSNIKQPITTLEYNFSSAWLYIPVPVKTKCQVKSVYGLDKLPDTIIYSEVAKVGQSFNQSIGPFPAAGRFFVKAPSSLKVKNDCEFIIKHYHVDFQSIE